MLKLFEQLGLAGAESLKQYVLGSDRIFTREDWVKAQDYIDRAVRLASDAGHRARIKSEIVSRSSALFEDIQVVREFERFFQETASTV